MKSLNAGGRLRRKGLQCLLLAALPWGALGWRQAHAQRMNSGSLLSFEDMVQPLVKGAPLLQQEVSIIAPILADNGTLVPVQVQVQSPMTEPNHVTHIYLLSQRNPVTQVAVFNLGPWNAKADISTRIRLAGTQDLVALARLSNGEFRYQKMEIIVTESACVDAS
jgi:sulfur-oxidizing protein SoxY